MGKLIDIFKKKPSVRKCPVCKQYPRWDCWELLPDQCIELWALRCDKTGFPGHYYSTSYWRLKEDAIIQWNDLCDDIEDELKSENN